MNGSMQPFPFSSLKENLIQYRRCTPGVDYWSVVPWAQNGKRIFCGYYLQDIRLAAFVDLNKSHIHISKPTLKE